MNPTNKFFFYSRQTLLSVCLCLVWLCIPLPNAGAQTYGSVAIGGGGFVTGIITCKTEQNLMYARTDVGGAYRWDAPNSKWIPLLDWVSESQTGYLGVESLAIDPQSPNKVYMLVGTSYFNSGNSAIIRSSDYGNTFSITDVTSQFKAHGNGLGRQSGEKLQVDPNNSSILYCGTRWNGLFKSTDAGATWTNVSAFPVTTTSNDNGISFVLLDGSSVSGGVTQRILVGVSQTGSNFYISTDGGTSFTAVSGGPTSLMPQRAALASDGNLFITYANGIGPYGFDQGQIWKYNISAGTWTNVTPSGVTNPFSGISVDPDNANRLVTSTCNTWYLQDNGVYGDRFFLSTDGGSSWTDLLDNGIEIDPNGIPWIGENAIHWTGSIEFDPFNTQKVWVCSGNGVFATDNIDATSTVWKFTVRGLEETVPQSMESIPDGPVISVIGDYDGFRNTEITQYGAIHTPRMGTTTGLAYAALNTSKIVRVGTYMYYSTDMGISWTQTAAIQGTYGQVAVSADGGTILHCPASSGTTYRSTDNGSTWTAVSGLSISEARPVADPVNAKKFYALDSGGGKIYISTDGGVSFSAAGSAGGSGSKIIRTVPGKEGHLWVAMWWGGMAYSTDSGSTFSPISGVTYCEAVGLGKAATGATYPTVYIWGTVNSVLGLYRSTDQGTSWVRINDDDHEWGGPANGQFVQGDLNVYGRAYMSTAGRGIVYVESGDSAVAVTGVTVSPATAAIAVGETTTLTATVTPSGATNKAVTWSSSNTSVATVNSLGVVTGIAAGAATITVTTTDGNKTATCAVSVINVAVTGVSVSPASVSIAAGSTYTLTATIVPTNATNQAVTWSSDDTSVATVSSAGVVTGISDGTATITVTTQDGSYTATCTVTVLGAGSNSCTFGVPLATGLPSINATYTNVHILGTGGPSLDNVTTVTINWDLLLNGLWQLSMNTSDGNPQWWFDLRTVATWSFNAAQPYITFSGSGITGLDGAYWVTTDDDNLVLVSQTGPYTIYFSNSSATPTCTKNTAEVIQNTGSTAQILLYPNPFSNKVTLQLDNAKGVKSIKVVDLTGKVIQQLDLNQLSNNQIEFGDDLPAGLYFIQVNDSEGTQSYKLVKK